MPLLKHLFFLKKINNFKCNNFKCNKFKNTNKIKNCKLTLSGRPWPECIPYDFSLKGKR